jgi:bla regulator protein blaR1
LPEALALLARVPHHRAITIPHSFAALLAFAVMLLFAPLARPQSASPSTHPQPPAWRAAAGGPMEFEVASIHPSEPCHIRCTNIIFLKEDSVPPGGNYQADFPLPVLIEFAYNIMLMPEQERVMLAHLPNWVGTQTFKIEAKAPGNDATVGQMRLMMQSLLADRFKLAVHFETKDSPVLELVIARAGSLGPRIRPHDLGLACDAKWIAPADRTAPSVSPGGFMPTCGAFAAISGPNHTIIFGARDVTLQLIAANLGTLPAVTEFGRPVVDQTGFAGKFDFSLNWLPDGGAPATGAAERIDAQGPTFEEALRDQLGLKLISTHAPVQTLVIDHVEQPTPN